MKITIDDWTIDIMAAPYTHLNLHGVIFPALARHVCGTFLYLSYEWFDTGNKTECPNGTCKQSLDPKTIKLHMIAALPISLV